MAERLMFAHAAVDQRGDLALAFLAHFLSALPLAEDVDTLCERTFRDVLSIVDLITTIYILSFLLILFFFSSCVTISRSTHIHKSSCTIRTQPTRHKQYL